MNQFAKRLFFIWRENSFWEKSYEKIWKGTGKAENTEKKSKLDQKTDEEKPWAKHQSGSNFVGEITNGQNYEKLFNNGFFSFTSYLQL